MNQKQIDDVDNFLLIKSIIKNISCENIWWILLLFFGIKNNFFYFKCNISSL